jgi:hypothetical protein
VHFDRAPQQVEQHGQPVLFGQVQDGGDDAIEGTGHHAHLLADLIGHRRPHDGAVDLTRLQGRDEPSVNGARLLAAPHQRAHAVGRQDRPPEFPLEAHVDEQVAREQGAQHLVHPARMRATATDDRAIGRKALPLEIGPRHLLAMRLRIDGGPPRGATSGEGARATHRPTPHSSTGIP